MGLEDRVAAALQGLGQVSSSATSYGGHETSVATWVLNGLLRLGFCHRGEDTEEFLDSDSR